MIKTVPQTKKKQLEALLKKGYIPFAVTEDSRGKYTYHLWRKR